MKTKNRGKSPSKVGEDAETRLFEGAIVLAEQIINRNAICSAFPYLIDCPSGGYWWGVFLHYRIIKDLACLDKVAKYVLTRTQRLRFYLAYSRVGRLDRKGKQDIRRILRFFEGRE